jgi:hypothetical protein
MQRAIFILFCNVRYFNASVGAAKVSAVFLVRRAKIAFLLNML